MRVACGPFTTTEDLFYEPLNDLLRDVASNPPHFLFLVGPLLDASHPALNDAALADTYDSILTKCLNRIDAALKRLVVRDSRLVYVEEAYKGQLLRVG